MQIFTSRGRKITWGSEDFKNSFVGRWDFFENPWVKQLFVLTPYCNVVIEFRLKETEENISLSLSDFAFTDFGNMDDKSNLRIRSTSFHFRIQKATIFIDNTKHFLFEIFAEIKAKVLVVKITATMKFCQDSYQWG